MDSFSCLYTFLYYPSQQGKAEGTANSTAKRAKVSGTASDIVDTVVSVAKQKKVYVVGVVHCMAMCIILGACILNR